jgi:hypothetical protein
VIRRLVAASFFLVAMAAGGAGARIFVDGHFPAAVPSDAPEFSDNRLAEALSAVTLNGDIDFEALKKNRAPLDTYVQSLAATSPEATPQRFAEPNHQLAYWINAYNALVLQALVDRWPSVKSPDALWLGRFTWGLSWPVGGKRLTLRAVLDKKLRQGFGDPRALLAVHCGAMSCAALDTTPYMGDTIDGQLNDAARRFMADPDNVRLEGNSVHLSPLLQRYQQDFIAALPAGRTQLLQFVWAFLREVCRGERACLTRADLDQACGIKLDGCVTVRAEWNGDLRIRRYRPSGTATNCSSPMVSPVRRSTSVSCAPGESSGAKAKAWSEVPP